MSAVKRFQMFCRYLQPCESLCAISVDITLALRKVTEIYVGLDAAKNLTSVDNIWSQNCV
jgi:hypothetical protein